MSSIHVNGHLKGIVHVFWDLDHTIWDFSANARLTIFELYEKHQLGRLMDHGPEIFHEVYIKHNNLAWEQYRKGLITKEKLRKQRFRNTFRELNTDPDGISELFETEFVAICPTKNCLIPGAMEILQQLSMSYRQHIITNGFSETQSVKMNSSGISHFFESVTNSEEAGYQKPHPEIFRLALEKVKATPETSLMIGDNYEADILGAHQFGMRCILFDQHAAYPEPVHSGITRIRHLDEIKPLMKDLPSNPQTDPLNTAGRYF